MIVLFYLIFVVSLIGWLLGNTDLGRTIFYSRLPKDKYYSQSQAPRFFIPVTFATSNSQVIKIRHLGNPAKDLARDIEIITDGDIRAESWRGYSYRQIVSHLTPAQINDIKQLRSFLK